MDEQYYTAEKVASLVLASQNYEAGDQYGGGGGRGSGGDSVGVEGGPLRGVFVLSTSASASDFRGDSVAFSSPEPPAPQGDDTPSASLVIGSSYEWNANNGGDGLIGADMYGLPAVYVVDAATANYLRNVASAQSESFTSNNDGEAVDIDAEAYPSIVSELNYYMGPGGEYDGNGDAVYDSKKCLEWRDNNEEWSPRCAPLGRNSVWAAAGSHVAVGFGGGSGDGGEDGDKDGGEDNGNGDNNGGRPMVLVATSIDSTSMFHDVSPGANSAALNILALLMAANLLGSSVTDEVLDGLQSRIVFGFFQGESYGFLGSRRFLKDVVGGFEFDADVVPSVYKRRDEEDDVASPCMHPARADLTFRNLGNEVRGMIVVEQVGNLGRSKGMYVQGGEATDGGGRFAAFLSEVMVELSANDNDGGGYAAQASSTEAQDDSTSPLPPTPLSCLVSLSSAASGGVVLTGYDDAYVANSLYHSHLDSASKFQTIDGDGVAAAATLIARTAVAAAYQDADNAVDSETAAAYALELLPDAVNSTSDTFTKLYGCLFEDGNCETFLKYGSVERANDALRTGHDLGLGQPLGTPPSYYVSILDSSNGQAFVRASGKYYGSLVDGGADANGGTVKSYGEDEGDAFLVRPSLLEASISGLLNDYLGRGSFVASSEEEGDAALTTLATCDSSNDCSSVLYCNSESSAALKPSCAGGSCVCGTRSHYHPAQDEALEAAANYPTGVFEIRQDEEGVSALYTEPYWSNFVGVRIYNDAGKNPGVYAASLGAAFAVLCMALVWRLKRSMVKEKVY